MSTAGDQINRALRLLGVLAEGENPSAGESADALVALNQMLDSWSTEQLSVFSTMDQVFTWTAGQVTRTLGPTGNFVGTRPVSLDDSTYFVVDGISYQITILNQSAYNSISDKDTTSPLPQFLFVNATFPNASMSVYPVPSQDIEWHFVSVAPLDQPALLTTALSFPPGYLRAFAYNLAMEIAPEFGVEPPPQVRRIATISKRDLKRINNPNDGMSMPAALLSRPAKFNIYTGD